MVELIYDNMMLPSWIDYIADDIIWYSVKQYLIYRRRRN